MVELKISNNISYVEFADGLALLNENTGKYHVINSTGKTIWEKIEQNKDIDKIIREITSEFDIDVVACARSVNSFVDELKTLKIILNA